MLTMTDLRAGGPTTPDRAVEALAAAGWVELHSVDDLSFVQLLGAPYQLVPSFAWTTDRPFSSTGPSRFTAWIPGWLRGLLDGGNEEGLCEPEDFLRVLRDPFELADFLDRQKGAEVIRAAARGAYYEERHRREEIERRARATEALLEAELAAEAGPPVEDIPF